ncbi:MAG: hypothetical protein SFU86_08115 [Pirellulaceae bacterium]|nr:hypothetical protein [Pirellulaceae bacterium]
MLTVKEAVAIAAKALSDAFGAERPRLEEVELTEGDATWQITLSFLREFEPEEAVTSVFSVLADVNEIAQGKKKLKRDYKVIRVDAATGNVKSIRIRELQSHAFVTE